MFDLRYHVASLAAVFFALVIGILVGVALASHGLGNSERLNYERRIGASENEISRLNAQLTTMNENSKAATSFLANAYGAVMTGRLTGKKVGVVFLGSVDPGLRSAVDRTLVDAGGTIVRLRAITLPLRGDAIKNTLRNRVQLAARGKTLKDVGRKLADEFVAGGDTPWWNALEQQLVEERIGGGRQPVDSVIVARTAGPQTDGTSRFLKALLLELAKKATPVVAIEATGVAHSWVPLWQVLGIASVDDVDTAAGRIALAVVLSGAATPGGHYGLRKGELVVPTNIPPVAAGATSG